LVEVVFQSVEVGHPEPAVGSKPFVELRERLRADPVQPALSLRARFDEAGLLQDTKVLRHRRLADWKALHELADRPLAVAEQIEDREPARLGQDLKRGKFAHRAKIA
jgi:hypothetical protein